MWDITRKSDPVAPSSKDLKDISKEILQGNQRSTQKMKKEFDRVVADKDKEIYRLKNHSQSLIAQIKKLKNEKCHKKKRLKQLTNRESLLDKEAMTNPIEVEKLSDVKVQMMEIPRVLMNRNLVINKATLVYEEDIMPNVNRENTSSMIRKNNATRIPYS
jgi:hypothetical protein